MPDNSVLHLCLADAGASADSGPFPSSQAQCYLSCLNRRLDKETAFDNKFSVVIIPIEADRTKLIHDGSATVPELEDVMANPNVSVKVEFGMIAATTAYREVLERILFDPCVSSYAVQDGNLEKHCGSLPPDLYFACCLLFASGMIKREARDGILVPTLTGVGSTQPATHLADICFTDLLRKRDFAFFRVASQMEGIEAKGSKRAQPRFLVISSLERFLEHPPRDGRSYPATPLKRGRQDTADSLAIRARVLECHITKRAQFPDERVLHLTRCAWSARLGLMICIAERLFAMRRPLALPVPSRFFWPYLFKCLRMLIPRLSEHMGTNELPADVLERQLMRKIDRAERIVASVRKRPQEAVNPSAEARAHEEEEQSSASSSSSASPKRRRD